MASGILTPTEAVERFYHVGNFLYVQKHFKRREAQTIMSRGVQLPDLFDSLPPEEAQRELYHELEIMRSLCLSFWKKGHLEGPLSTQPLSPNEARSETE